MQKLICNFTYIHNGYCIIYFKCDIFAAFCSNRYCMKIVVFTIPFLHLSQDENRFMINIAWNQIFFRDRYDVHQICVQCCVGRVLCYWSWRSSLQCFIWSRVLAAENSVWTHKTFRRLPATIEYKLFTFLYGSLCTSFSTLTLCFDGGV